MKRRREIVRGLVLVAAMGAFAVPRSASAAVLELKLTGGLSQYRVPDLLSHLDGWNALIDDLGLPRTGRLGFSRRGVDLEGQIQLNLSRVLAVGLGFGYFRADEDTRMSYTAGGNSIEIRDRFMADIVPLTAHLIFRLPIGSRARLNLSAGVGYHQAKISWEENRGVVDDQWNAEKKTALGYQGAISFDFEITKGLALVVEAVGRSLRLKGLTGTRRFLDQDTDGVRIWIGRTLSGSKFYDQLAFKETVPAADDSHSGWREAAIDLSAVGIRAGVILKF